MPTAGVGEVLMFLWYKTGVPFDNPVRLPLGRVKKEREKYGDVVYHQFPNGGRVRGLLLLPGGVRGGAAAEKAAAVHRPKAVPLRRAHRRAE